VENVERRLEGTCLVLGGQDGVLDRDVESPCLGDGWTDRAVFGSFEALGSEGDRGDWGVPVMHDRRSVVDAASRGSWREELGWGGEQVGIHAFVSGNGCPCLEELIRDWGIHSLRGGEYFQFHL
jgi:hypothetical protein